MTILVEQSIRVLSDIKYVLNLLDTGLYARPIAQLSGSTIGQHTRHIIEFYQCLLEQAGSGVINYCRRKRDLDIEEKREAAVKAIDTVTAALPHLNPNFELILETDKEGRIAMPTNMERELFYNIEHCIHHMAMIKVGILLIAPHISVPENFGVAPSTVQHRKAIAQTK